MGGRLFAGRLFAGHLLHGMPDEAPLPPPAPSGGFGAGGIAHAGRWPARKRKRNAADEFVLLALLPIIEG